MPPDMAPELRSSPASYRAAAEELNQILTDLDDDHLDVDVLADKVRRAAELIAFCRARISSARMEVEQVVADLDPPSASPDEDSPDEVGDGGGPQGQVPEGAEDPTLLASLDDAPTVLAEPPVTASDPPAPGAPAAN